MRLIIFIGFFLWFLSQMFSFRIWDIETEGRKECRKCMKNVKKRGNPLVCGNLSKLTPILADTLWCFHTWLPAVKKIHSVVRLTEGDVEDAKLQSFTLNSSPSPHLKPLWKKKPPNILWEMALSATSRSVSCPRQRPEPLAVPSDHCGKRS